MTLKLNGVAVGCGTACRKCSKDEREGCWYAGVCLLGYSDIGISVEEAKRRKSKSEPDKKFRGFII